MHRSVPIAGRPAALAALLALLAATAAPGTLRAQTMGERGIGITWGAQVAPVYSHSDAVPGGSGTGDLSVAQPVLMAHAAALGGRLLAVGTLNLEGLTMADGELTPGAWGEGYVDRRHPHTYLHELVVSGLSRLGGAHISASVGKGFAPFGTDDPMTRPVFAYPVNHHLAQILERAVAVAAVAVGPAVLEGGLFNGDEPERPGQWPRLSRFGDSWSARLTLRPFAGLEVQGSFADVQSPEHRPGAGLEQRKWSASGRGTGRIGANEFEALGEWARSAEAVGTYVLHSVLGEGAWRRGRGRLYYRFERTERPEEERTADPFRSLRPHLDNTILATTRWTIHTAGGGLELGPGTRDGAGWRVEPFAEVALAAPVSLAPAGFDPAIYYGRRHLWAVSLGARLGWGMPMHRMGRYGVAAAAEPEGHHH